ncbi:MAG: HAD family phosphatase [Paracoccaceae bacterium]
MTPPKLIIFDCDGVLVDSEHISNQFLLDELASYGLTLTMADCDSLFVGGTFTSVAKIARGMGADLPEDWVTKFYERLYPHLAIGVPMVTGVANILDRVIGLNLPHCVVTNGSVRKMKITLGQNGYWEHFQNIQFSAHTYNVAKPDPELLLIATRYFNTDPADCIVIDDSPSGCTGAANAGMPCIGYAERSDPEKLAATGANVIRSMSELPSLLGL